ncbi:glycosyltransferase family 4 protein [Marinobacter piscensis]|uniref:glycosyltransferase family 4 protein n=1 Tax=Marinobacter piscensis TaxID=1562308 RepID=UPI00119D3C2F
MKAAIAIRQIQKYTGAVRNVIEHCGYLRSLGYEITILSECYSSKILSECDADLVRVMRWPIKGTFRRVWFDKCVQRWRRKNPTDLFISHGDSHSDDILVMHNCVRLHEEKCGTQKIDVAPFHDSIISESTYRVLIANSRLMARDFIERYGVAPHKIRVFHQGVDTDRFNSQNRIIHRKAIRQDLGLTDNEHLIGLITSGDFTKRNVSFFIDLAAYINERLQSPAHFLVVGKSGTSRFADQIKTHNLKAHIHFMNPVAHVEQLFHALDLHVFPALLEEYGRVVLEGLACGTPSVVSSNVGASELMLDEAVPEVIHGYELQQWGDVILGILNDREQLVKMEQASVELAKNYSMKTQEMKMRKILASVTPG